MLCCRKITLVFLVTIMIIGGGTIYAGEGQLKNDPAIYRGITEIPAGVSLDMKVTEIDLAKLVRRGYSVPVPISRFDILPGDYIREEFKMGTKSADGLIISREYASKLMKGKFFKILFDVSARTLNISPTGAPLSSSAQAAIDLSPQWLHPALRDTFEQLTISLQDTLADQILTAPDPRYIDEIAFLVAHLGINMLNHPSFDPYILVENARYIYEIEPYLGPYVDLVDHGVPGVDPDYYTTTKYQVDMSGVPTTFEIPKEIYYWYVVHPIGSDDSPFYHDPTTGKDSSRPNGLFWRPYYFFSTDTDADYTKHYVMRTPSKISLTELQGWGYSSHGYFGTMTVNPLRIINDSISGEPVLIEQRKGKGSIMATMMPVEKAYNDGKSSLLINMLDYFYCNSTITNTKKIALFMDRDPWGVTVIQDHLTSQGRNFTVFTSADMATVDLSSYRKVIIASAQPRSFYDELAANKSKFESWVGSDYNLLEFHGACDPVDDWAGLDMPGGLTCVPQSANYTDSVTIGGQPLLKDVISNTDMFWDMTTLSLPGTRFVDPNDLAIDKLLNFCTDNMYYSVVDYAYNHPSYERTVRPERIIYNHYGNCGELQDIITAAARSALMPMASTSNSNEDHVWNEFWLNGSWHFVNVGWSDGGASVDVPGGGQDKDYGGGKDCSMVVLYRGDGLLTNVTNRYSNTITLNITITDSRGKPIDGARVLIWSEMWGSTTSFFPGYTELTDKNGQCTIELGDNQNYAISVDTVLGRYPASGIALIINDSEAIAGSVFDWTHAYGTPIQAPVATLKYPPVFPTDPWYEISVMINATDGIRHGTSVHTGNKFTEWFQPGELDFFITDIANYTKFKNNNNFDAMYINENLGSMAYTFKLPSAQDCYLIVSNKDSTVYSQVFDMKVDVFQRSATAVPIPIGKMLIIFMFAAGYFLVIPRFNIQDNR